PPGGYGVLAGRAPAYAGRLDVAPGKRLLRKRSGAGEVMPARHASCRGAAQEYPLVPVRLRWGARRGEVRTNRSSSVSPTPSWRGVLRASRRPPRPPSGPDILPLEWSRLRPGRPPRYLPRKVERVLLCSSAVRGPLRP